MRKEVAKREKTKRRIVLPPCGERHAPSMSCKTRTTHTYTPNPSPRLLSHAIEYSFGPSSLSSLLRDDPAAAAWPETSMRGGAAGVVARPLMLLLLLLLLLLFNDGCSVFSSLAAPGISLVGRSGLAATSSCCGSAAVLMELLLSCSSWAMGFCMCVKERRLARFVFCSRNEGFVRKGIINSKTERDARVLFKHKG